MRRFAAAQDGAAAVEFGLVAAPFLALMFAIMETALVFFAGQTLEAAAADSARLIMTGQAQTAGLSARPISRQAVCDQIFGLFDCANGVYVDVKTYTTFAAINTTPPVDQRPAQHDQHRPTRPAARATSWWCRCITSGRSTCRCSATISPI